MDGPDRIGKEEMKEFVESYRDELIELVCVNYMMSKFDMIVEGTKIYHASK